MMWVLMGLACSQPIPKTPILLVTVDGLRADRVGAYGHNPTETPAIDRLAEQGTKFLRAYTASSAAAPAQVSILTGLAPPSHGMRIETQEVATKAVSLPQLLKSKGWSIGMRSLATEPQPSVKNWFRTIVGDSDYSSDELDFTWLHTEIKLPSVAPALERDSVYDEALNQQDSVIGREVEAWQNVHPAGFVLLVGTRGLATTGASGEGLWLTDDWVRVPLIVSGPGVQQRWEISDVVSTLDIASTLAELVGLDVESQGFDLFRGGSTLAYSESMQGWADFRTHPMYAFTDDDGRYIEGVYGAWHPGGLHDVRKFEDPESVYVEEAARLQKLRASFPVIGWDPKDADVSTLDLRHVHHSLPAIAKARRAKKKGRYDVATRTLGNIDPRLKTAPLVLRIQEEIKSK
jgi:membrane-anchored protein YejM (alkaline phosphatase superfamily)